MLKIRILVLALCVVFVVVAIKVDLFVALTVLYAVVAVKVDQWFTISCLGFKLETPQSFMKYPRRYHRTRMLLFAAAVAALFFESTVLWYLGAVGLAVGSNVFSALQVS